MDEKISPLEKEMSFLDHLEELRWHFIRALMTIILFEYLLINGSVSIKIFAFFKKSSGFCDIVNILVNNFFFER